MAKFPTCITLGNHVAALDLFKLINAKVSPNKKSLIITGHLVQAGDVDSTCFLSRPQSMRWHGTRLLISAIPNIDLRCEHSIFTCDRGGARLHTSVMFTLIDPRKPQSNTRPQIFREGKVRLI
ncbi:hypothetical protein LX36DRAFT_477601 [Colletotrichum falcatum]|nr:hypothetical protein LX36DRAFT_477601 [Colletotrichum falcatum]